MRSLSAKQRTVLTTASLCDIPRGVGPLESMAMAFRVRIDERNGTGVVELGTRQDQIISFH